MNATIRRMYAIDDISRLAGRYAGARGIATSTLARLATGSSTWFERCATGRVTIRSALAVVQWLSDRWPEGIEWPGEVARPDPSPGSPASAHFTPSAFTVPSVAVLEEAKRCMEGDAGCSIWLAARRAESAMIGARQRLDRSGRVGSPAAICRALGVRRSVYDDVVRRYRDEVGAGRWPRIGSNCDCMLTALIAAGDVRFASRRRREAA